MNTDLVLRCPTCGADALADDEFCESCGMALGVLRDSRRDHLEFELGSAAAVSDRGLVHARNEDAIYIVEVGGATIAVVCDGVSTSAAPQVAAQVAADAAGAIVRQTFEQSLDGTIPWQPVATVAHALKGADEAVLGVPWMRTRPKDQPPSCTIVVAIWDGSVITVGWSGDSRAYWIGSGGPRQLTSDHSLVQEHVDAGLLNAAQAADDPAAHVITRWLGADAPISPPPVVTFVPGGSGQLVLCSDGLWNYLESLAELSRLIQTLEPAAAIDVARALTRRAIERGGSDNITVAVVDVTTAATAVSEEDET